MRRGRNGICLGALPGRHLDDARRGWQTSCKWRAAARLISTCPTNSTARANGYPPRPEAQMTLPATRSDAEPNPTRRGKLFAPGVVCNQLKPTGRVLVRDADARSTSTLGLVHLNNLSALSKVCSTPHKSGRPTSAQASISFSPRPYGARRVPLALAMGRSCEGGGPYPAVSDLPPARPDDVADQLAS